MFLHYFNKPNSNEETGYSSYFYKNVFIYTGHEFFSVTI